MIFFSRHAFSQTSVGITSGINLANGRFETTIGNFDPIIRFNAGIFADVSIHNQVSIEPVLLYSVEGWGFNSFTGKGSTNMHFIDLQLIVKYDVGKKFAILAGPEVGYLLSIRLQPGNRKFDKDNYADFNIGALVGVEFKLAPKVRLILKYVHGFTKLARAQLTDSSGMLIGTIKDGKSNLLQLGFALDLTRSK